MSVLTFDLYASTKRDRSMREVGEVGEREMLE